MKKTLDILGMTVITIQEGVEAGTVKGCVINAAQRAVAGLVIEDGKWYLGAKVLPLSKIISYGENVILTEQGSDIEAVTPNSQLAALFEQDVRVIGTKVLTRQGIFQGEIAEYSFAENGDIGAYDIATKAGELLTVPAEQVITLGKELIIVSAEKPSPASPSAVAVPQQARIEVKPEPVVSLDNESAAEDAAKTFEDKQRKFLLGKKATRLIETDNGIVIVAEGGEITEEVLQKAKLAGKFVELSMSIQ